MVPDRVPADSGSMPTWQFYVNGLWRNGQGWALHQHAFGGMGSRPGADGLAAVSFPYNVRNVSVEWSETETPVLFVRRELIADSGGAGRWRGGLGEELACGLPHHEQFFVLGTTKAVEDYRNSVGGAGGPFGEHAGHEQARQLGLVFGLAFQLMLGSPTTKLIVVLGATVVGFFAPNLYLYQRAHERAEHRLARLQQAGQDNAQLYLADDDDGIGGGGAFFLLLDDPEVYGLPPDPVDTRRDLAEIWSATGAAALALGAALLVAVLGGRRG